MSAPPESAAAADAVQRGTACDLIARSDTLLALGMTGTPYDPTLAGELSGCQMLIAASPHEYSSFTLAVVSADYVAESAPVDPAVSGATLVALPDLGEDGHFLSLQSAVDPASDPPIGLLVAASGDLGVSLGWSMTQAAIPFAAFEQAVRETLAALP